MNSAATNPRRVALFSTTFLAYSQTFIYDEIRHHERFAVSVFSHNRANADRFALDEVNVLAGRPGPLARAEALAYKSVMFSPTFYRRLSTGDFSLLHAHFGTGSVYALPYHELLRLPLVVTFHGFDVPVLLTPLRFEPGYWRYWAVSKWMLRTVDRFLAASDELARMLIELGAPPERVHVWRLGVELPPRPVRKPRQGPAEVLMVGRFVEKKGFEYGLESFARVLAEGIDARLRIVGDGPLRDTYEQIIRRHAMSDRVEFLGVLPHTEVLCRMEQADVLVAPSVVAKNGNRESGLLVVKEANARQIPAVATLHGGIPEIIDDGKTGFLVAERNPEQLADRLARLLRDPALCERMGLAAREKMEQEYDIRERVRTLECHYDEVLSESKRI